MRSETVPDKKSLAAIINFTFERLNTQQPFAI